MTDTAPEGYVLVGAFAGAFGVKGELRLKSFCAVPEEIEGYSPLLGANGASYDIAILRPVKNGFAARAVQITTKEDADALKGVSLYARRDQLPALPDDEFYHADLIGLAVYDSGGAEIGRIKAVQDHGAGDLLEVQLTGRSDTVLIPFTLAIVPTVDLATGRVVIDPPDGLL